MSRLFAWLDWKGRLQCWQIRTSWFCTSVHSVLFGRILNTWKIVCGKCCIRVAVHNVHTDVMGSSVDQVGSIQGLKERMNTYMMNRNRNPTLSKKNQLLKDSNSRSLGLKSSAFFTRPMWSCSGKRSFSLMFWENIAVNYLHLKSFTRESFSKRFVKSCFRQFVLNIFLAS